MMYPKSMSARSGKIKTKKAKVNIPHVCWRCGRNGCADPLDKHHLFGGALRAKSERYGLCVYLCHNRCHENGPDAAHQNPETMQKLHEYGQPKAMAGNSWTQKTSSRSLEKIMCKEGKPMLRLKANKTSLYRLVGQYAKLPKMYKTEFKKAPRQPDYWLKWFDGEFFCSAFFTGCVGGPLLSIKKKARDGTEVSR